MDGMVRAAAEAAASNLMPRLSTWKGNTEFIEDCARCIGQVLKSLDAGAGGGEYRDLYASLSRGDAESVFQKHPHLRWESLPDIQMTPSELAYVWYFAYLLVHQDAERRADVPRRLLGSAIPKAAAWGASPEVLDSMQALISDENFVKLFFPDEEGES